MTELVAGPVATRAARTGANPCLFPEHRVLHSAGSPTFGPHGVVWHIESSTFALLTREPTTIQDEGTPGSNAATRQWTGD